MKRALAVALVVFLGAVAAFFLWPETNDEPVKAVAEGAYSPSPHRTSGSAIVRAGTAHQAQGRVVDERGLPIPGAQVFLAHEGAESMADERCDCPLDQRPLLECLCPAGAAQVALLVSRREGELQPDQTVQTDGEGAFRFADPPPGTFLVWATAPGHSPAFRHGVEAGKIVELALGRPQAIWGKVVDEADRPIPGALLTAVPALLPRFSDTTSSEGGLFRIDGLALGPVFLSGAAPGYLPAGAPLSVPTGAATTLVLPRARVLEGLVHDKKQAAKGAIVRINADHFARAAPAPSGSFRVEGLFPGSYTVTASAGRRFAAVQVELTQPVTRVDLLLEEAVAVHGRVFDDGGSPVAGATVVASVEKGRLTDTRSQPDGTFAFDGIPPGARLTATHEGYEPASARVGAEGGEVELVLHPQAIVVGVVISAQDEPLPQVQVVARGAGQGVAMSDASGVFKLALASAGPVTLLAHHSTYGEGEVSVDAPASGVKLKLSTMGAIRARLVDPQRKPIPGGRATAWKDDPALQRYDTFSSDVPSGEDGVVILAGLPKGPHRLRLTARGFQAAERRNVPIPESGELDLGDVTLEPGLEISGVVLKDDGTPAQGAFVHVRSKGTRGEAGVPTGRDGAFVVSGLKEGTYAVSAFLDKAVAEATARAGDKNLELRLPAPARLRGRVIERDGRPLSRFVVDGSPVEAADGRFEVGARAWRENVFFRVGAEGHLTAFKQARLVNGIADAGDVVLDRALSIEGTVNDEAGAPVSGAAVLVGDREEAGAQEESPTRALSAANGRFHLDGFAPGPVTLIARRGNQVAEHTVVVEGESLTDVVLTLQGKGSIEGLVRGGDGAPVVAEIHARGFSTTSDALGRYRLDGLVPGTYLVLAVLDSDTFRSSSKEAQVRAGEASHLDFDLGSGGSLRVTIQGATAGSLHLLRADGAPMSGARGAQTTVVVGGQATLTGLQEGRYAVLFWGQGAGEDVAAEGSVEVPATGTAQLVLTARPISEQR